LRISFDDADGSPLGKISGPGNGHVSNDEASRGLDRASVVHARRLISAENHLAKGFAGGADLPSIQELFAQEVQSYLEGGRAAILRPSKRRMLIAAGIKAGLRPFQTQLIMAQVQEDRRHVADAGGKRAKSKFEEGIDTLHVMEKHEGLKSGMIREMGGDELVQGTGRARTSDTDGKALNPDARGHTGILRLATMIGMTILLAGSVFLCLVMWMG